MLQNKRSIVLNSIFQPNFYCYKTKELLFSIQYFSLTSIVTKQKIYCSQFNISAQLLLLQNKRTVVLNSIFQPNFYCYKTKDLLFSIQYSAQLLLLQNKRTVVLNSIFSLTSIVTKQKIYCSQFNIQPNFYCYKTKDLLFSIQYFSPTSIVTKQKNCCSQFNISA